MLENIFGVAGSALNAQLTRMNATASNLANASTVSTTDAQAFRAKRVVFKTVLDDAQLQQQEPMKGGVQVAGVVDDSAPTRRQFDPKNPLADAQGYVYQSNVSEISEMVEMMSAARSYQNNVETVNTAKQLMLRTLDIAKA